MPSRSSPVTAEATMVNAASDSTGFSLVATSAAPAAPRITAGASWGPAASPRNELVMAAMLLITTRPARAHPVPRHSSPSSSPENITAANEIVSETPITPTTNPARTWRGADRNSVLADAIGAPYRPAPRRLRHEIGLACWSFEPQQTDRIFTVGKQSVPAVVRRTNRQDAPVRRTTRFALLIVVIATACSGGVEPATTLRQAAPTTTVLDPSGCPVADESFCVVAADVGNALAAGDVDRLLALSRVDRIVCADVAIEHFPGCTAGGVLEGHGVSNADQLVELVGDSEYRAHLDEILGALDPAYSDEHGTGDVRLLGVGTCGPDQPGRRSYHVAWTAAMDLDAGTERVAGSFELTFRDNWRIALSYLDTLERWEQTDQDPFSDAFCEAGRNPWQS